MTELKIIKQQEILGKDFTIYGTAQEPLFLAKDVATWIEHSNPSKMLNAIDEDEKTTLTIGYNGNMTTNQLFLTEDGLYEVLMQSRKPIAKQFKKEVKSILKQIRMTSGYVQADREAEFINAYFPNFSDEVKLAMVNDLYNQNRKYKEQIANLEPQAQAYLDMMAAQGYMSLLEVSAVLEQGRTKLCDFLRVHKVLTKQGRFNVPYGRFRDNGCFTVVCSTGMNGRAVTVTLVSPKGLDYIYKLIKKHNATSDFNMNSLEVVA